MRCVGIDPGMTGAAVVVDHECSVIDVQTWRRSPTPPILEIVRPGDVVAVEQPYVQLSPASALKLSEWIGRLLATLPIDVIMLRPLASTWRAKVLRAGRIKRDPAKKLAVHAAMPYLREFADKEECPPPWLPTHTAQVSHDLAEAFLIARFAWGWRCAHPEKST